MRLCSAKPKLVAGERRNHQTGALSVHTLWLLLLARINRTAGRNRRVEEKGAVQSDRESRRI
jgi:hypothetical protein